MNILSFRCDKCDILSYCHSTGISLQPILLRLEHLYQNKADIPTDDVLSGIESIYSELINGVSCACLYVPHCAKNFFKFWWDEELKCLKEASVNTDKLWKAAGRPRCGPIFTERQSSKSRYRQCIRDHQRAAVEIYTIDLHEALLRKDGPNFWKVWRSQFNHLSKYDQVDG